MILVHLCTGCGHPQREHVHDPKRLMVAIRGSNLCGCCERNAAPEFEPEPTPRETYAHPGGEPEPLYEPGSTRNAGGPHREHLCGCDACKVAAATFSEVPF